jgi:hypothetical protein
MRSAKSRLPSAPLLGKALHSNVLTVVSAA